VAEDAQEIKSELEELRHRRYEKMVQVKTAVSEKASI